MAASGKSIGRYLRQPNIPEEMSGELMRIKIDLLNTKIEEAANRIATATYVVYRNITEPYQWIDDLHPSASGFRALSLRFKAEMGIVVDT